MICKLTCYGGSREEAIATSITALDKYVIRGVTHNIPLLRDVLTEPTFNSGTFTTSYLQETYPDGFQGVQLSPADTLAISSLAAVCHCKEAERARVRLNEKKLKADRTPAARKLVVEVKGEKVAVTVVKKAGSYTVTGPAGNVEVVDNFSLLTVLLILSSMEKAWWLSSLREIHQDNSESGESCVKTAMWM